MATSRTEDTGAAAPSGCRGFAGWLAGVAGSLLALFALGVVMALFAGPDAEIFLTDHVVLRPRAQPLQYGVFVVVNALVIVFALSLGMALVAVAGSRGCLPALGGLVLGGMGLIAAGVGLFAVPFGSDWGHVIFFGLVSIGSLGLALLGLVAQLRPARRRR